MSVKKGRIIKKTNTYRTDGMCPICEVEERPYTKSGIRLTYCRACQKEKNKNKLKKSNRFNWNGTGLGMVFGLYKQGAERRNLDFKITKDFFMLEVQKDCHYCGSKPNNRTSCNGVPTIKYNGLDRVNNDKGYELGNLVPCCYNCNHMKSGKSEKEFLAHVKRIVKFNE